ncbi:MAG: hypothetical protein LBG62_02060 [Candidatus Methanoplasma sp.]|jgi:hypothetical protein|nr:hypothetical protein [Candidatus Methanoplasma sp.]
MRMRIMSNKKIIAIAAVVVLVAAGAGAFLLLNKSEKRTEEINIVTGLEGVGSGFYYKPGSIDASKLFVTDQSGAVAVDGNGEVKYRAEGWNRLVIGSPGVVSIQHIQLKTIVEIYLKDQSRVDGPTKSYKLVAWREGEALRDGEVGYVVTGGAASAIEGYKLDIGLTWQPQLAKLDAGSYDVLVRTNELFPHQTCCLTIANQSFLQDNPGVSERVVWAIVQATEWLNAAKEKGKSNPSDPDYLRLLEIGRGIAGPNFTTEDLIAAIEDVEYAWGDIGYSASDPLSKIKSDIALQTEDLSKTGDLRNTLGDLGFSSYAQYADALVDDSVLKRVLANGIDSKPPYDSWSEVRFVLIAGDIHQLPVHIANALLPGQSQSLYSQVGITFKRIDVSIGAAVISGLKANEADFGVTGQPSLIVDNVNNKLSAPGAARVAAPVAAEAQAKV